VARTHHRYAWGGFLEKLFEVGQSSQSRSQGGSQLYNDAYFMPWIHQIGARSSKSKAGKRSDILTTIPSAFHSIKGKRLNPLARALTLSDLPRPHPGGTGLDAMVRSLKEEYVTEIEPALMSFADDDAGDSCTEPPSRETYRD